MMFLVAGDAFVDIGFSVGWAFAVVVGLLSSIALISRPFFVTLSHGVILLIVIWCVRRRAAERKAAWVSPSKRAKGMAFVGPLSLVVGILVVVLVEERMGLALLLQVGNEIPKGS